MGVGSLSSGTFFELAGAADLQADEMIAVDLPGGLRLAVYNVEGQIYATDDRCTHGNASLADGDLDGFLVMCPFHDGRFDIRTGCPIALPVSVPIKTYGVEIREGRIGVVVPSADEASA